MDNVSRWESNVNRSGNPTLKMQSRTTGPTENTAQEPETRVDVKELVRELAMAKQDLEFANRQFDEVADPSAVDEIVYRIAAAERKFDRLYQVAKVNHVTQEDLDKVCPDEELFQPRRLP